MGRTDRAGNACGHSPLVRVAGVSRLLALAVLSAISACTCVQLPARTWACEREADCPDGQTCRAGQCEPRADAGTADAGTADAGPTDAGATDAGEPDAGPGDGGTDGGPEDAGSGDPCDGGLCRFDDGGWCQTWACVAEFWPQPAPEPADLEVSVIPLPAGIDGGAYGWFGGVLLPDGTVLAIAHTADRFLRVHPKELNVTPLGPPLATSASRKYLGGVLAPNGRVYVFPYEAHRILELTWQDGGLREVGPALVSADGGAPLYAGGVVDLDGELWSVSERHDAEMPVIRFSPDTEQVVPTALVRPSGWGGWFGVSRLPSGELLAFPKETFASPALSSAVLRIRPRQTRLNNRYVEVAGFDARDAGVTFQGAALTHDGLACAPAAGPDARYLCVGGGDATLFTGPIARYGPPATFGDGRVWTSPDDDALPALAADGGSTRYDIVTPGGSTRYSYLGLVATPHGLVAISGGPQSGGFLHLVPKLDGGTVENRPLPVLLSPYFNKL